MKWENKGRRDSAADVRFWTNEPGAAGQCSDIPGARILDHAEREGQQRSRNAGHVNETRAALRTLFVGGSSGQQRSDNAGCAIEACAAFRMLFVGHSCPMRLFLPFAGGAFMPDAFGRVSGKSIAAEPAPTGECKASRLNQQRSGNARAFNQARAVGLAPCGAFMPTTKQ
jgi:hypothetical protein